MISEKLQLYFVYFEIYDYHNNYLKYTYEKSNHVDGRPLYDRRCIRTI